MTNKNKNIKQVEGNPAGNAGERKSNSKEMNLAQLPIVLKRVLQDWEDEMKMKTGNKYFDFYEELSALTGISPTTIRHYTTTTEQSAEYPPVNKLIQICLVIGSKKPLEFIKDYADSVIEN